MNQQTPKDSLFMKENIWSDNMANVSTVTNQYLNQLQFMLLGHLMTTHRNVKRPSGFWAVLAFLLARMKDPIWLFLFYHPFFSEATAILLYKWDVRCGKDNGYTLNVAQAPRKSLH